MDIEEALDETISALRAEAISLVADRRRHPGGDAQECNCAINDYRRQKRERFATLVRLRREASAKIVSGLLRSWAPTTSTIHNGCGALPGSPEPAEH